jgi:hypothetical protein
MTRGVSAPHTSTRGPTGAVHCRLGSLQTYHPRVIKKLALVIGAGLLVAGCGGGSSTGGGGSGGGGGSAADPCNLISAQDAGSLLGAAAASTKEKSPESNGDRTCEFTTAASGSAPGNLLDVTTGPLSQSDFGLRKTTCVHPQDVQGVGDTAYAGVCAGGKNIAALKGGNIVAISVVNYSALGSALTSADLDALTTLEKKAISHLP